MTLSIVSGYDPQTKKLIGYPYGSIPRGWSCFGLRQRRYAKRAAKLKNAAHSTAAFGDMTRVETTVAMEFAAS